MVSTKLTTVNRWLETTQQTRESQKSASAYPMHTQNKYQMLSPEPLTTDSTSEYPGPWEAETGLLKFAGRPTKRRTSARAASTHFGPNWRPIKSQFKLTAPLKERQRDTTPQVVKRPYKARYFLPGRSNGKHVQFLIDTECATNLLLKVEFNQVTDRIKGLLEESQSHDDWLMVLNCHSMGSSDSAFECVTSKPRRCLL